MPAQREKKASMSREEALQEIEQILNEHSTSAPVTHEEVACQDMKAVGKLLLAVLAEMRGSDGVYRRRARIGFLAPPPAGVPPV